MSCHWPKLTLTVPLLVLLLLVVLSQSLLAAREVVQSSAAEKAQSLYREGRYREAQVEYEKLLAGGVDGRVEYNLGNCEYRQAQYARALWRYERALRELGARSEIVFNRDLCLQKLGIRSKNAEGLLASIRARVAEWRVANWFTLSVALEALGLLFLILMLRRYSNPRLLVCLVFVGLAAVTGLKALALQEQQEVGVVVLRARLPLRSEPRTELPGKLILDKGRRAEFVAKTAAWIKLRLEFEGKQQEGWIPRASGGIY